MNEMCENDDDDNVVARPLVMMILKGSSETTGQVHRVTKRGTISLLDWHARVHAFKRMRSSVAGPVGQIPRVFDMSVVQSDDERRGGGGGGGGTEAE